MRSGSGSKKGEDGPEEPDWQGLLESAAKKIAALLLTAGGLIGFVAFAGGVIVWTRLAAAKVPPDQAVAAFPRAELVAVGASFLLLFGFFGALALGGVFLIDRGGRATPGMSRGLLLLLLIEGVAVILLPEGLPLDAKRIVSAEAFALFVGVALWATTVGWFIKFQDTLPKRRSDELEPEDEASLFRTKTGGVPFEGEQLMRVVGSCIVAGLLTGAVGAALFNWQAWAAVAVGILALGAGLTLAIVVFWLHREGVVIAESPASEEEDEEGREEEDEEGRVEKQRRPHGLELKPEGIAFVAAMMTLAVAVPCTVLHKAWLAVSLVVAMGLAAALWRIADISKGRFVWYGLAVLISVPLFGILTAMARNLDDPQVQPMALIREADGADEAIHGLYVTEADERVYFATVATEGCTGELAPHSGRLYWVPKSEVVAMSLGPQQGVADAARTSMEMSYALTPSVEVPSGGHFDVENGAATETLQGSVAGLDGSAPRRLENVGAAVSPTFGRGLRLVPEQASPGEIVTLRMSAPNHDEEVRGFGPTPRGTVRLGGVPVAVQRDTAMSVDEAEFVKTVGGRALGLEDQTIYGVHVNGNYFPLDEETSRGYRGRRFLRLDPSSVTDTFGPEAAGSDLYARLAGGGARIDTDFGLAVAGRQNTVELEERLLRLAWYEDRIRFRVPDNAASGVVSVECEQLGGQPLLQVVRPSTARITVRMQAGSHRVVFDSRHSGEEGGTVESRQWTIAGRPMGGRPTVSADLPPRLGAYSIQLVVTNVDGQTDPVDLKLLRLPATLFEFNEDEPADESALEDARQIVSETVKEVTPPVAIELHGHSDDVGSAAYNMQLSRRRVVNLRDRLLPEDERKEDSTIEPGEEGVPVTTRAFGETCPIDRRGGRRRANRRVEVFILGRGANVASPAGCRAGRITQKRWHPPSDEQP